MNSTNHSHRIHIRHLPYPRAAELISANEAARLRWVVFDGDTPGVRCEHRFDAVAIRDSLRREQAR